MIEGMPWPAWVGIAGGGYVAFITLGLLIVRSYVKGDAYPRHTVEQMEELVATQQEAITTQADTISTLTKSTALANAVMENLNRAASEVSDP